MKHSVMEVQIPDSSATTLVVRKATDADRLGWDKFVWTAPEATFFHRYGWKPVIESCFGHRSHYLIAESAGQVVGVLPLFQVKSLLFGHGVTSLPFGVYGGPVAVSSDVAQALVQAAVAWSEEIGAAHLELRNRQSVCAQWPRQDLYVCFRREIFADEDANMLAIPRKQRAMVRKGIKAGLTSELDTGVDRFFDLYLDNVHRHGTPGFPKHYFAALAKEFGEDVEVLTVLGDRGQPLSSVLSFYFRDEVLPYYAGDHVQARETAANDFKYWELMRRGCARGLRVFDYGRSKRGTGSFDFKKNWGFEPEPLHYEYWLRPGRQMPQNNPANPKYQLMIKTWRRMPRSVVSVLGPYLSKYLG